MDKQRVILKPGKEKSLLKRHPWIFSGAIASIPPIENGEVLPIYSFSSQFLGIGYFHSTNSLSGRVLTFLEESVEEAIRKKIDHAVALRKKLFPLNETNCYRLINAEGDGIPGLIVDVYDTVLSIQINTCGIERLRPYIIDCLIKTLQPQAIFEKSTSSARQQEGLLPKQGCIFGSSPNLIWVRENTMAFLVDLDKGQKTGFFLDQREMRQLIYRLARGKTVLNCFSYSGSFSLYALKGGAKHVTSIDCDTYALELAKANTLRNEFSLTTQHLIEEADVFHYLKRSPLNYDLIILDPPAFAKKKQDVISACSGYKEINRLCFEQLKTGSFLLTSSCSHFIDPSLFQNVVFQAALDAGKEVHILSSHIQASDHPISLMHPEGHYLKSLLLYIL